MGGEENFSKLFIGGLSSETTEDSLRKFYSKWGKIIDVVVMKDPNTRRSRGFGFVTYETAEELDLAQSNRPHMLDGRDIEAKRAVPKNGRDGPGQNVDHKSVKKIFVGGIKDEIEESHLKDYFSQFGELLEVSIINERGSGKKRGFAFLTFKDYDVVDKITLKKYHTVNGLQLETKKAFPMQDRGRDEPRRDFRNGGDGGRFGMDRSRGNDGDRYGGGRSGGDRYGNDEPRGNYRRGGNDGYRSSGGDRGRDGHRGGNDGYRGGNDGYRGGNDGYRGGNDGYRGGNDGYRGGNDGYRGGNDGYRGGSEGYRGGSEGYRGGNDSYRGGSEAYRGANEGYRGGSEGYRGDSEGYRGTNEGYRGAPDDGYRGAPAESYRDASRGHLDASDPYGAKYREMEAYKNSASAKNPYEASYERSIEAARTIHGAMPSYADEYKTKPEPPRAYEAYPSSEYPGVENGAYAYMGSYNQHELQAPKQGYQDTTRTSAPYPGYGSRT